MNDDIDNVSFDTYRFHLDKRVMRVRYSDETEDSVDIVIEPIEPIEPKEANDANSMS